MVYGCQAMTIGKGERTRLKGFLNVMLWIDKVTNEKVSNLVKEKSSLYCNIKRPCNRFIGGTFWHEGLAGTILEGTVEIRKRIGRQRLE